MELDYDSRNPFVVCSATFAPIYRGTKDVACSCCGAKFIAEGDHVNKVCPVCNLGAVGVEAAGLVVSPSQR